MNIITLKNTFHNTSINVRVHADNSYDAWIEIQNDAYYTKTAQNRLRRIEKALCGISGCMCGTVRS